MDLEAIGGAATGGLIASTFEKPAGGAGEAHTHCSDCGAEVAGRFCADCGQPTHVHRTLVHLGEELLHGVMHFDSRTWRTLPLLVFRPGTLTREWVHGKRTRYVSPLAMFLFTVFLMFMALSYLPASPKQTLTAQQSAAVSAMAHKGEALGRAERALKTAPPKSRGVALEDARKAEVDLKAAAANAAQLGAITGPVTGLKEAPAENIQSGLQKIDTGNPSLDAKIRHKLENPELAIYKLQQTFYKFSFLLVPISIPFVALLFLWKRNFTFYDHGVFVLYSLTFMSVLAMAVAGMTRLGAWTGPWVLTLGTLAIPLHMFFQLKGAYGLGVWSALWRTGLLMIFCAITLTLFVLAIVWLGMG